LEHLTREQFIKRLEEGVVEYISAANDDPKDESRWANIELARHRGEEVPKTEARYDPPVQLAKKLSCSTFDA
jgi:hypothetical protein